MLDSPVAGAGEDSYASLDPVYRYHDGTKHHFHAFARSLGYLDWASQPKPFRSFTGADSIALFPSPSAAPEGYQSRPVTFDRLGAADSVTAPLSAAAVGDVLRHALGLSAWKQYGASRWALRVNPSSGNLHPTEAYLIAPALRSLGPTPAVYHYAADSHSLERRCTFDQAVWTDAFREPDDVVLVALTSIHWREAWKYGERAFRYCQHDLGHAIAATALAASLLGWRSRLLPAWSHAAIAAVTGISRDPDFVEAEREEPGCVLEISRGNQQDWAAPRVAGLVEGVRRGRWSGRASQLSEDHAQWSFIDEIAAATADPGRSTDPVSLPPAPIRPDRGIDARSLILQRRSAVAFDGRSAMTRAAFIGLLANVLPTAAPPYSSGWWTPCVHLLLFVHRVEHVAPGLYFLARTGEVIDRIRPAAHQELLWERADAAIPLYCLARGDTRTLAKRLSCTQDIAADGFFSVGMLAEFEGSLTRLGPSFYRHLFWETGIVGQVLYLEAEAAGARATGIGCFFDDPVHEAVGLHGRVFQSLYHFTVGIPIEDTRLTVEPGYAWERSTPSRS
jgi:SagB-type dehydrogenase family enzyme